LRRAQPAEGRNLARRPPASTTARRSLHPSASGRRPHPGQQRASLCCSCQPCRTDLYDTISLSARKAAAVRTISALGHRHRQWEGATGVQDRPDRRSLGLYRPL